MTWKTQNVGCCEERGLEAAEGSEEEKDPEGQK